MNEIKISKEVVEFGGIKLKVIEGGFGEGYKILTTNQIAEIHNMEVKHVNELFFNNVIRFKDGIDFIDLKVVVGIDHNLLENLGYSKMQISKSKSIIVYSERGYGKLIKLMDSDLAWDIYDELSDRYFNMRKQLKDLDERANLLLGIYKGGAEAITYAKQLADLEIAEAVKPLNEVIEVQTPKAEYFDALVDSNLLTSFRDTAKELKIKETKFIEFLLEKKYIYRDKKGKLKPSAQYVPELFQLKEFTVNGYANTQTKVTTKGREVFRLLTDKLLK